MKSFLYLDHTADIKFRAQGKDYAQAYAHALLAVSNLLVDLKKVKKSTTKRFCVKAKNYERLLFELIEEFLFLFDTEGFIVREVRDSTLRDDIDSEGNIWLLLELELVGDYTFSGLYEVKLGIKAMTYHEMRIYEEHGHIIMEGVVDV